MNILIVIILLLGLAMVLPLTWVMNRARRDRMDDMQNGFVADALDTRDYHDQRRDEWYCGENAIVGV
jgi:hypothetical protein